MLKQYGKWVIGSHSPFWGHHRVYYKPRLIIEKGEWWQLCWLKFSIGYEKPLTITKEQKP